MAVRTRVAALTSASMVSTDFPGLGLGVNGFGFEAEADYSGWNS